MAAQPQSSINTDPNQNIFNFIFKRLFEDNKNGFFDFLNEDNVSEDTKKILKENMSETVSNYFSGDYSMDTGKSIQNIKNMQAHLLNEANGGKIPSSAISKLYFASLMYTESEGNCGCVTKEDEKYFSFGPFQAYERDGHAQQLMKKIYDTLDKKDKDIIDKNPNIKAWMEQTGPKFKALSEYYGGDINKAKSELENVMKQIAVIPKNASEEDKKRILQNQQNIMGASQTQLKGDTQTTATACWEKLDVLNDKGDMEKSSAAKSNLFMMIGVVANQSPRRAEQMTQYILKACPNGSDDEKLKAARYFEEILNKTVKESKDKPTVEEQKILDSVKAGPLTARLNGGRFIDNLSNLSVKTEVKREKEKAPPVVASTQPPSISASVGQGQPITSVAKEVSLGELNKKKEQEQKEKEKASGPAHKV